MAKIEIYEDDGIYRARLRTNDGRIDAIAGSQPTNREMVKHCEDWKRQVKSADIVQVCGFAHPTEPAVQGECHTNTPVSTTDSTATSMQLDADAPNYEIDNNELGDTDDVKREEESSASQEEGTGNTEEEGVQEAEPGLQDEDSHQDEDGDNDDGGSDDDEDEDRDRDVPTVEELVANNTKAELIATCEEVRLEAHGNKTELATRIYDFYNR